MSEGERGQLRVCGRSCSVHSEDASGEQAVQICLDLPLPTLPCCAIAASELTGRISDCQRVRWTHTALRELFGRAIDRLKSSWDSATHASELIARVPRLKSSWVYFLVGRRALPLESSSSVTHA